MDRSELITKVRELSAKATPGPWSAEPSIPSDGFECYWLRAFTSIGNWFQIGAISGPQSVEHQATADLAALAPGMAAELLKMAEERVDCECRILRLSDQNRLQQAAAIIGDKIAASREQTLARVIAERDRLAEENERLMAAAKKMLSMLTADGDPPSVRVPQEYVDEESGDDFIESYAGLEAALTGQPATGPTWGDSGPIPGQSFGDEFAPGPPPVTDQSGSLKQAATEAANFLDALELNMLRNDVDMRIDGCNPPSLYAEAIRNALADLAPLAGTTEDKHKVPNNEWIIDDDYDGDEMSSGISRGPVG